jgi:hypothetical protein
VPIRFQDPGEFLQNPRVPLVIVITKGTKEESHPIECLVLNGQQALIRAGKKALDPVAPIETARTGEQLMGQIQAKGLKPRLTHGNQVPPLTATKIQHAPIQALFQQECHLGCRGGLVPMGIDLKVLPAEGGLEPGG